MPALLTSTWMPPHAAASASTAAFTLSALATSTFWNIASPPAAFSSSTTAAALASEMSHAATRHCSFANATAVARPMPGARARHDDDLARQSCFETHSRISLGRPQVRPAHGAAAAPSRLARVPSLYIRNAAAAWL